MKSRFKGFTVPILHRVFCYKLLINGNINRKRRIHLISDSNDVEVTPGSRAEFETLPPGIRNVERTSLTHHVATTCTAHAKTGAENAYSNCCLHETLLNSDLNCVKQDLHEL